MHVWTFGASFGLAMPISELYEGYEWIPLPPSSSKKLAFLIDTLQENWHRGSIRIVEKWREVGMKKGNALVWCLIMT
jgi:hypothetical protein